MEQNFNACYYTPDPPTQTLTRAHEAAFADIDAQAWREAYESIKAHTALGMKRSSVLPRSGESGAPASLSCGS